MAKYKRKIKLIKPRLQMQLTLTFLGLSVLGLLMQFLLFLTTISRLAALLPNDGNLVMEEVSGALLAVLGITLLAILPLTYLVGVLKTFRIAGPVYRMEQYLKEIQRGGYTGPCRTRKGDQLQDLVDELNRAVLSLAQREAIAPDDEGPPGRREAA